MFNLKEKNKKILIFFIILLLGGCMVTTIGYFLSKLVSLVNMYGLQFLLSQYGNKAAWVYFAISFLQPIALPLPEPLTIMAGSAVLGSFNGAVYGFLGTVLGIVTMYFFTRVTGEKFIKSFVSSNQIEKFNKCIKKNETIVILFLFILPILPDEAICIGAGLTKINPYKFISVAVISKMITAFSLSYSINFIKINSWQVILIVGAILAVKKLIDMKKAKIR